MNILPLLPLLLKRIPQPVNSYHYYQAVDFARDESFQQGVFQPDSQAAAFWNRWRIEHPEQEAAIEEARQLVLTFGPVEMSTQEERVARMKRGVFERILLTSPPQPRRLPWWRGWAAVGLVLLLAGSSFWGYQRWAYVRYATGYGETQTLKLPDGSEVTLKANSRLQHPRSWSADQDREVWLVGEAFFHVKRKSVQNDAAADPRWATFVVHATEAVDVAVLGTEFNVNTREETTEVILKSGRVRVDVKHEEQPQTLLMKPGDLVEVAHRRGVLTQHQIDLPAPKNWKSSMLIFNDATLAEVAKKLRYTYGVTVVFEDEALAQRKFKGFVPTDNLDVLLEAFAKLYGINIEQHDHQLIFTHKTQ